MPTAFALEDLDVALDHGAFVGCVSEVRVSDDGDALELDLRLLRGQTDGPGQGELAGTVRFLFRGIRSWLFDSEAIHRMGVVADHPALIAFEASTSRLSYRGEPADAEAALAALHLAHARTVGDVIPIDLCPGSAFPSGWSTGTIAEGATSLMRIYAEALQSHGVEPVLTELAPLGSEPPVTGLSVFEIGSGYAIAAGLETHGDIPPNDYV